MESARTLTYDSSNPKPGGWVKKGANMEILVIAAATIAVVWIIVLWGSRYFGPR